MEKVVLATIFILFISSFVVFAEDIDFQVSIQPQTVSVTNCEVPNLAIIAKNPYAISSMLVYANNNYICKLGNGEQKTCSYSLSAYSAGTQQTSDGVPVTITGVGEKGSFDAGKTKTRSFNIIVNHYPSNSEINAQNAVSSAQTAINNAQSKITTYESKNYDMASAKTLLSTANSQLSQGQSQFNQCNFDSAITSIQQAEQSANLASSQAENAYQAQLQTGVKPNQGGATGNVVPYGSIPPATLTPIIVGIIIIIVIGFVIYIVKMRKPKSGATPLSMQQPTASNQFKKTKK